MKDKEIKEEQDSLESWLDSGWLMVFGSEGAQEQEKLFALKEAIVKRCYPTIYARLRRQKEAFSPRDAYHLCMAALQVDLSSKAILTLLEHCPPLDRFLYVGKQWSDSFGLVERAAAMDRVDILDTLLQRGGNVNRHGFFCSPLEAAIEYGALQCVERLLQEPKLDTRLTPRLLNCWSFVDTGRVGMDFCLQAVSPRLLGKQSTIQEPFPLPDGLTLQLAARAGNWRLLSRLCTQRENISERDAKKALKCIPIGDPISDSRWVTEEGKCLELSELAQALSDLLTVCPDLLRLSKTRQLLVKYYIEHTQETGNVLAPWLQSLRGKKVPLEEQMIWSLGLRWDELLDFLSQWHKCLPDGPFPSINRYMLDINRWEEEVKPNDFDLLFHTCVFQPGRKPAPGTVSPLAQAVLQRGRYRQIVEQFQPGGVLAGENPEDLLQLCSENRLPKANRAVVLAYTKTREERYEL